MSDEGYTKTFLKTDQNHPSIKAYDAAVKKGIKEFVFWYQHDESRKFTIMLLLEQLASAVEDRKKLPVIIMLKPKYFIDLCYYTEQFINKPTFIGIPIGIYYE